eukprot:GFUD01011698.1.p1 GENE.GFUD01011698.1~~GFUD01011698.1.p1  ORF type:complete len:454 (+),score=143.56 GFUD01011698.1:855-2216(+)
MSTCSNCLSSLTLSTHHIQCCDPLCPALLLCLSCFCSGSQPASHSVSHPYSIQTDFSSGWSLEEDLSLLEVMEQCGYGSWEEVSRLLPGKARTAQDIKHHFDSVFVNGESNFKVVKENSFSAITSDSNKPSQVQYFPVVGPCEDPPRPGPANPKQSSSLNNLKNCGGGGGWFQKLTGYNPARAEFSQEWDNQAESDLSLESAGAEHLTDQTWSGEETQLESELKLSLVSMYNSRLRTRQRVKRLVKEHSLIHKAKVGKGLARLRAQLSGSSWDLEQFNRFSQLLCALDLDFLMEGFLVEFELRSKVLQLQEVRRAGVKMLGSVEMMECLMSRRREQMTLLGTERVQDWLGGGVPDRRVCGGGSKRVTLPLDIVGLPGCEKLNEEERELCSQVRIIPNIFTEIKDVLMGECEKSEGIRLADARSAVKIDVNKTRRIYDFLLQQGTIWAPRSSNK